jgi:antitoxin (DNA-binding transcriptional repressor) of toxin-antitoxin stability system
VTTYGKLELTICESGGTARMNVSINAKRLRQSLPDVVAKVRKGTRFTVLYRSRPAFQIVPIDSTTEPALALADDPLYRASAVGASTDGETSAHHDRVLYER